jgi:hypothetical protein
MKLVKLEWIDATGSDGWISKEDLENELPGFHTTVGFVVKETEGFITITMNYDETKEMFGAWMLVPKIMITKITEL